MMDYDALRELRNHTNPFAELLGITLEEIREGSAEAVVTIQPKHTNPVGSCHGGVLFTLADVAAGAAAASFGQYAVTVSSEYHYLGSAVVGEEVHAVSKTVKNGKTIIVLEVKVVAAESGKLLGTACITYYRLNRDIVV